MGEEHDLTDAYREVNDPKCRVQRPAFFRQFAEEHAVQYFYEPFLESFDPQLREDFGVWYTPEEIVRYMVRSWRSNPGVQTASLNLGFAVSRLLDVASPELRVVSH